MVYSDYAPYEPSSQTSNSLYKNFTIVITGLNPVSQLLLRTENGFTDYIILAGAPICSYKPQLPFASTKSYLPINKAFNYVRSTRGAFTKSKTRYA